MPPKRSSEKHAQQAIDDLVFGAREKAREGADVAPGSPSFWALVHEHLVHVSDLLTLINDEVKEEHEANAGKKTRPCIACGGEVFKRHLKGRWPLYCDTCKLSDRS